MANYDLDEILWKIAYWVIGILVCIFIIHVIVVINYNLKPVDIYLVEEKYSCLNSKNLLSNGDNKFIVISPDGEKNNYEWAYLKSESSYYDFYMNKNFGLRKISSYNENEFSCDDSEF